MDGRKRQSGSGKEEAERTQEELLEQIAALAASYTPEWRFDRENLDAGTALAILFAELFAGTARRFQQIPEKHQIAFFDQIGVTMKAPTAAGGYVIFDLSGDGVGGVFLKKGITVSGPQAAYETEEAVYVTPAKLMRVLLVDGARDYIGIKEFSKPFRPFAREEQNVQEHSFYLCHDEVLRVSGGAQISLAIDQSDPADARGLSWMLDRESCLFFYGTQDGFAEYGERRIEGGRLVLHVKEDGEMPGCMELFGKTGFWLCCRYGKPWHGDPFTAGGIRLFSRRENMKPDMIWNQNGEQESERLLPFGENPLPFSECYFASAEALGKPGARVTLSFKIDYEKIPFDNSVKADRRWKLVMRRADFVPDPEYDITIDQVVWEYYNGAGWSRLMPEKRWETLFDASGARAGQQVCLTFVCPPDAALLEWQMAPTRYLRVRVLHMTNLYRPKGTYLTPVLGDVRFAYDYGENGRQPELIAAVNNREQRILRVREKGAEAETFPLLCGQKDERMALYLGFHLPLQNEPLRFLCAVDGETHGELPLLEFSYSGDSGFLPLSVVDETEGFQRSGTLTWMGKEDMTGSTVCGETAYWIRITDERGEYRMRERRRVMPQIQGIYANAVRVRAKEGQPEERCGAAGNQMPGSIKRIDGSFGYVNRVINPLPIVGGHDGESPKAALRRGSAMLRHGGRAVTVSDFEELAREASQSVKKAVCCPNCNAEGEYEPGSVAVALLLEEFESGSMYFEEVRGQVARRLSECTGGNLGALGRLYVVEAVFLEMDCYMEAVVSDRNQAFAVQEEIAREGKRFLHPLTGNYDGRGWEIGELPNDTQMMNALKSISGLDYIQDLRLTAYRTLGGRRMQVTLGGRDRAQSAASGGRMIERFAVPLPGKFQVVVSVE